MSGLIRNSSSRTHCKWLSILSSNIIKDFYTANKQKASKHELLGLSLQAASLSHAKFRKAYALMGKELKLSRVISCKAP